MPNDSLWTGAALDDLRSEFGDVYDGRTVLVTGADGFMGSHLTDALVELGATRRHSYARPLAARSTTSDISVTGSRSTSPTSPTGHRSTT